MSIARVKEPIEVCMFRPSVLAAILRSCSKRFSKFLGNFEPIQLYTSGKCARHVLHLLAFGTPISLNTESDWPRCAEVSTHFISWLFCDNIYLQLVFELFEWIWVIHFDTLTLVCKMKSSGQQTHSWSKPYHYLQLLYCYRDISYEHCCQLEYETGRVAHEDNTSSFFNQTSLW